MRKVILTAFAAVLALSLSASIASARTGIAVTPTSTTLTLINLNMDASGIDVQCNVTMDAALHARTNKSVGSLAGFADITVSTGACTEGNAGLLVGGRRVTGAQGPFHITYASFRGTLPSIESIRLVVNDVTFWITTPGGTDCLTNGAVDINGDSTGGTTVEGMNVSAQSIPLSGDFACNFSSGTMEGRGDLSTNLTISLF
jgi:hypothetical protein